jgi:hypothetical protein
VIASSLVVVVVPAAFCFAITARPANTRVSIFSPDGITVVTLLPKTLDHT